MLINVYYVAGPASLGDGEINHGTCPKRVPTAVLETVVGVNNNRMM